MLKGFALCRSSPWAVCSSVFITIYRYGISSPIRICIGAYITIAGAIITILLNIWWIPEFRYSGAAWATFVCYAFMMVVSYMRRAKILSDSLCLKKLMAYLVIVALIYLVHRDYIP